MKVNEIITNQIIEELEKGNIPWAKPWNAELTSAFLSAKSGIDNSTRQNETAYIQNWLKALKNDTKFIIEASAKAQKAFDYITK